MFKRIIWFGVGAATGAAGTVAAGRKVKATVDRVVPPTVRDGAVRTGRAARERWTAAVSDGRTARERRESELRERLRLQRPPLD